MSLFSELNAQYPKNSLNIKIARAQKGQGASIIVTEFEFNNSGGKNTVADYSPKKNRKKKYSNNKSDDSLFQILICGMSILF